MNNHVLLIEDDRALRKSLTQTLDLAGMTVTQAGSYIEAKDHISDKFEGVVLTDIRMPGKDGFDVLQLAQERDADLPVLVLTGEADIPMAVRAMTVGAHDFLTKPCPPDTLIKALKQALELRKLTLKTRLLARQLELGDLAAVNFPGQSAAISSLRQDLRHYAALPMTVHISGDEGSGKQIAAQTLHALSGVKGPFQTATCRDLSPSLLDRLEQDSAAGTLCLNWLEDASAEQHGLILSLLERSKIGRIITTSNAPLPELHQQGLNANLYYALNVATLSVPSLKQRKEDLHLVFESFVLQASRSLNHPMPEITTEQRATIGAKDWPGNLPELRNFAQRIALGLEDADSQTGHQGLSQQVEAFERSLIIEGLSRNGGKAAATALDLDLPRKTFYDKMKRHNLKPEDFKPG